LPVGVTLRVTFNLRLHKLPQGSCDIGKINVYDKMEIENLKKAD